MTFALNPTNEQTEIQFQLNAVSQNGTSTEDSTGTSTGVKVGASIGAVAGAALIIGLVFLLFRRRRRSQGNAIDEAIRDETNGKVGGGSSYTDTEAGKSPLTEVKPHVPPKGEELHGYSSPSELGVNRDPAELASEQSPAEMYSPHEYHPNAYPMRPSEPRL